MGKYAPFLLVALLAVAFYCMAGAWAAPAPAGAANAAVEKVADAVNNPAQFKNLAAGLTTNFDLVGIATAFRHRTKGGLGVGTVPGAIAPDGIELIVIQIGQKGISAADLKANKADYQRMAEVTRGIAEAMPGYGTKYTKNVVEAKQWNGLADDMQKGSDGLIAAVKSNNLQTIKKAAGKLNQSCVGCHTAFRDN